MGMGMNFMGMGLQPMGMGLKLMGMWWGRGNFCVDGVGMGLMSTTVSLFNVDGSGDKRKNSETCTDNMQPALIKLSLPACQLEIHYNINYA